MTKFLIAVLMLFLATTACIGQFGIKGEYTTASYHLNTSSNAGEYDADGYQAALFYWSRLKNNRIEFFPEIYYGELRAKAPNDLPSGKVTRYGLSVPVSVYPLDFRGDCDCPTFSKQNDRFKKGFFLQVIPGYLFEKWSEVSRHQAILGLGVGLDIGLSNLLTISPIVHKYTNLVNSESLVKPTMKNDLRASLRILLRPDYRQ